MNFQAEPLYVMDGSAFIFRSFYAYRSMARSDGFPTNALYMVVRLLLKLLREERPELFAFVMDGKGPTFRHQRFPAYKAQRSATPEPLVLQLAPLRSMLELLGLPVLVSDGCEADDYIASLAFRFRDECPVVIVGADKDLKQCLHENVLLWDPAGKDEKITTLESFRAQSGMEPSSWPDYQALVGDSSDNIPGIAQVGPKSADELIRKFTTLEELFNRLPAVPPKLRAKLEGQRENALLYRELTRLRCDTCPVTRLDELRPRPVDIHVALDFMAAYELRSLARELESMGRMGFLRGALPVEKELNGVPELKTAPAPSARAANPDSSSTAPVAQGFLAGSTSGPQPVSPIPGAAGQATGEQGRLLNALLPPARFTAAVSIADLPPLPLASGSLPRPALALLGTCDLKGLREGEMLLACRDWERLYSGPVDSLAHMLQAAEHLTLIMPDSKALGKLHPALRALPPERCFDLCLAAYLLSPEERGYAWEQLVARYAEQSGGDESAHEHPGNLALNLFRFLQEQLKGAGLEGIFHNLEMPLVPVLTNMEERGVDVDKAAFAAFLEEAHAELAILTQRIHTQAGRVFNIRSSQQLADVLFAVLDLPKAGKTKGGAMSTSQDVLEKLIGKHPIIETLLEFRKLEKLRSTYLEPLPRLADASGRIHTTFNQTATATGRLSSSNPNLQNIPIRGPLGTRMRGCFTAPEGKLLVCADYSQIELRVLGHLSEDPTLLEAFRNNEDIHARTAGLLYDLPLAQVTPDMRRNAKTINFGLIYGMGAQKLAQELHTGMKEAKAFIERYFERLSRLKLFYDAVEEEARQNGFVSTMAGRRRLIPDILSQNTQLRALARRQAINTRIQGSAADIIKMAMLAVEDDALLRELEARLLLQIHDELLLEAPEKNAEAAGRRLAELMSAVKPGGEALCVPLLAEWGTGKRWSDAH